MDLTKEEHQAIASTGNVRVTVDGVACVLVRADLFDKVCNLLAVQNADDPRGSYPAVLRTWDAAGSPLDAEIYQDLA
jgi:hypothetical protein